MKHSTKSMHLTEMKLDDDTGTVKAVIATMGVVDKDGDVTLPGFFGEQKVAIAWAHDRARLVGKGRIFENGNQARFDGRFFLDTIEGKQAYLTVKEMDDLQDWSYGFNLREGGAKLGQHDNANVRFLTPLDDGTAGVKVAEVSPVLVGAGEGTGTTHIKSDGLRFVEQAEQTAQAVELLYSRADEIRALRADKGTDLGADAVARLLEVKTRLAAAAEMFGTLVEPAAVDDPDDYAVSLMAVQRHLADARLVTAGR